MLGRRPVPAAVSPAGRPDHPGAGHTGPDADQPAAPRTTASPP
jgi:hypothetical protein